MEAGEAQDKNSQLQFVAKLSRRRQKQWLPTRDAMAGETSDQQMAMRIRHTAVFV